MAASPSIDFAFTRSHTESEALSLPAKPCPVRNRDASQCAPSSNLQSRVPALSPTSVGFRGGWVDPNELHMDLSASARRRGPSSRRRCDSPGPEVPRPSTQDAPRSKSEQRAERRERLHKVLQDLSKQGCRSSSGH